MLTIDYSTTPNYESALGTGTNELENDTGAYTNLYSGQIEGALEWFAILLILVTLLSTLVF